MSAKTCRFCGTEPNSNEPANAICQTRSAADKCSWFDEPTRKRFDSFAVRQKRERMEAAAPEMYEALLLAERMDQIGILNDQEGLWHKSRAARKAALAKASGSGSDA